MRKEIPILYSTPMVQAKLDGIKTQTRRLMKDQPEFEESFLICDNTVIPTMYQFAKGAFPKSGGPASEPFKCPYGMPGDLHYVRETWFPAAINGNEILIGFDVNDPNNTITIKTDDVDTYWKFLNKGHLIPSIHMPKEASRIWDEVIDVRVERLHDISEKDAIAEGLFSYSKTEFKHPNGKDLVSISSIAYKDYLNHNLDFDSPIDSYKSLWESINGKGSWNENPWVWVITTKTLSTTGRPSNI